MLVWLAPVFAVGRAGPKKTLFNSKRFGPNVSYTSYLVVLKFEFTKISVLFEAEKLKKNEHYSSGKIQNFL